MKIENNFIGMKFGKWTVIGKASELNAKSKGVVFWICECSCDKKTIKEVSNGNLKHGISKSCGCSRKNNGKTNRNHSDIAKSRLYKIYSQMKSRCINSNSQAYDNYGGRGIVISDEWLGKEGYLNFSKWALESGYKDNLTIDRIDVNGNYEPSNCKWSTKKEQANNRRSNVNITINNVTRNIKQWSELSGIRYATISQRIAAGVPMEKLLEPVKSNKSGYKGILWSKKLENWSIRITFNKKIIYIGSTKILEQAIRMKEDWFLKNTDIK